MLPTSDYHMLAVGTLVGKEVMLFTVLNQFGPNWQRPVCLKCFKDAKMPFFLHTIL